LRELFQTQETLRELRLTRDSFTQIFLNFLENRRLDIYGFNFVHEIDRLYSSDAKVCLTSDLSFRPRVDLI